MSSSFIQIKPIGSLPMGMLPCPNPLALSSCPEFSQARRRVSCNLFGRPERGAINETYRQLEKQRFELFQQRYSFDLEDFSKPSEQSKSNLTRLTTTNIAESRLSGSGGESLIEKELREHEMKLKQQRKKTVNCNEKPVVALAGDRIKSRNLKSDEYNTAAAVAPAVRAFMDNSKSTSGHGERPKPYARQQSSMTDYYTQRKTVVCNNSRTVFTVTSVEDEAKEVLPDILDENFEVKSTTIKTTTRTSVLRNRDSFTSSSALSSQSENHSQQCEDESSQEQISLHTMPTDVNAELV